MALWETLNASFEEHSLLWLLASSVIGGIVGAFVKFSFENVLGPGYARSVENRNALRRHSDPLLRAAEHLGERMENMLKFHKDRWFDDPKGYYRLSTLYLVGCYFGVARILEREAYLEYERSRRRARRLSRLFIGVFGGLSSWDWFKDLWPGDFAHKDIEDATVRRHHLTAIGELMIRKNPDGTEGREVIGFVEFSDRYDKDPEFRKWFDHVGRVFVGLESGEREAKWNRVVVFAVSLRLLVCHLVPKTRRRKPKAFPYLDTVHPKVRERLVESIRRSGYEHRFSDPLPALPPVVPAPPASAAPPRGEA